MATGGVHSVVSSTIFCPTASPYLHLCLMSLNTDLPSLNSSRKKTFLPGWLGVVIWLHRMEKIWGSKRSLTHLPACASLQIHAPRAPVVPMAEDFQGLAPSADSLCRLSDFSSFSLLNHQHSSLLSIYQRIVDISHSLLHHPTLLVSVSMDFFFFCFLLVIVAW